MRLSIEELAEKLNKAFPVTDDWAEDANCKDTPVEIWFPTGGHDPLKEYKKRLCENCTVQKDCKEYALQNPEIQGQWAGTGHAKRQAERRERKKSRKLPRDSERYYRKNYLKDLDFFLEVLTRAFPEMPYDILEGANCKGTPSILWFHGREEQHLREEADAVCNACEVKAECEKFAVENISFVGNWAGTSHRERKSIRRSAKL